MADPSIREIERRAEAGDADAQYALAAVFAARGQADLARASLNRAAAQGHADALFTLAGALLTRTEGAREQRGAAVAGLKEARDKGSVAALRVLAALTAGGLDGGDADWTGALLMMREACDRDDPAAMREIAALLLEIAPDDEDGAALLREASRRDTLAKTLVDRRRGRGIAQGAGAVSLDRAFARLAAITDKGAYEQISSGPRIGIVRAAFGPDLCDHLIGVALPRLKRGQVLGADGQRRTDAHRTSWGALLGFGFTDLPTVYAGQRMARLAELPHSHAEAMSIFRYQPGQEYRVHYDFLGPNDADLGAHGQRLKTVLGYLNDGYGGGETYFLAPDIRIAGKTGDILVFDNVDAFGAPDFNSRHAGLPVTRGVKWLASLWFRDRPWSG